eukprot:5635701-Amphidinium_carterae.1
MSIPRINLQPKEAMASVRSPALHPRSSTFDRGKSSCKLTSCRIHQTLTAHQHANHEFGQYLQSWILTCVQRGVQKQTMRVPHLGALTVLLMRTHGTEAVVVGEIPERRHELRDIP